MAELIKKTDNLNQGREKLNAAITDAEVAKVDAGKAVDTSRRAEQIAQTAEDKADNVQSQFNQVIIEGDSSVEAAQARVPIEGEAYPTLKARLDAENAEVTSQLAENVQRLKNQNSNAEVPLNIPTYYRYDNHAVHPSVLYFETPKYGWRWVMAFTPYSEGRDVTENPSIVVSDDGYYWYVPNGLINPLVEIPPPAGVYYSDTELIDNGIELEMWYRETNNDLGQSRIWRRKSSDCINWTPSEIIFDFGAGGENSYISPTVILENGIYNVWYRSSNGGRIYKKTSSDLRTWSNPELVNFDYSTIGETHNEWHLQIRKFENIYMAIVNARRNSDNEYRLIYLKSSDGINFDEAKLLVRPSYSGWDNQRIYRASIVKYGGWYFIYYSGFSQDNSNYIGLAKGRVAYDLDELVGMKAADFNSVSSTNIESDYKRKGIEATGQGNLKFVNSGVGGANIQPTDHAKLTVFTESKNRKGFYEAAGYFFDSSDNTSIYRQEKAMYINPTTKAINYHQDGALQTYARIIQLNIAGNGGDGSVGVRYGNDFFVSVESMAAGLKINLKNMPTAFPFANIVPRTSKGLVTADNKSMGFMYVSEVASSHIIIGLKENAAANHTALSLITSGSIDVCIIF